MLLRNGLWGLLTVFIALPALSSPLPVYREIKDWIVACDNTGDCEAIGATENSPVMLRLQHGAGPEGASSLRIESARPLSLENMRLDGRPLKPDSRHWQSSNIDGYSELSTTHGASVRAFIDAARNGMRLSFGDDESASWGSLSGLSAAMLLIDEAQGRLGTMTALLRRGPQSASHVPARRPAPLLRPAAPAPEALSEADRQRLIAAVRKVHAKRLTEQDCFVEADGAFDQAYALTDSEALVFVECWRGAYQASSLLFRTPIAEPARSRAIVLPLPFRMDDGREGVEAFTSAEYATEKGLLFHSAKGRGLADCGESAAWVFDGEEFQLSDYHYLGACRGGNPGDWPRLWRSRTN